MDSKSKNEENQSTTTTEKRDKKKENAGKPDGSSQIDLIIGSYGRYQFMIFLFKITIGMLSASNNLGVSFYAPSSFISYWCADIETGVALDGLRSSSNSSTIGLALNASSLAFMSHSNPSGLPVADKLQMPPGPNAKEDDWSHILRGFLYNTERARRRSSPDFNSDTPRNLRKECTFVSPRDNQLHKCTSFKYDTGIWISTIINEWDLVCDRSIFVSITQSLFMTGSIVSFMVFGVLSDRYGRWRSLLIGYAIEVLSGFGCAFSSSITQFMIFRFLLGFGMTGRASSTYLTMIEWTGPEWRMHISTLGSLGWVIGYCSLPWLAMFFLHFRHMQLAASFFELTLLFGLFYLPESPRWLLTHHRFEEARKVLLRAARFNGLIQPGSEEAIETGHAQSHQNEPIGIKSINLLHQLEMGNPMLNEGSFRRKRLNSFSFHGVQEQHHHQRLSLSVHDPNNTAIPPPVDELQSQETSREADDGDETGKTGGKLKPYTMHEFELRFERLVEIISQKEFTENEDRPSFADLLRWKNLRKYTFILGFAWCCNAFIYYGIALMVGEFGGKNLFVSFTLAGVTELPSMVLTLVLMKFLPRRSTNLYMYSIILLLCCLQAPFKYYDIGWLRQSNMILAKLFNSCAFICILYQTMELFPTSIRQTAYSSCALAGRIGSILAPFVRELSHLTDNLAPPLLYAALSLLEIVFIRHLPETKGSDMPDTLLEAEKFKGTTGKRRK